MKTKKQTKKNWGFDLRNLDTSVRPTDDFFHYSSGGWIKRNTIPATEGRWGSFDILRHENKKKLKAIVEEVSKKKNLQQGSEEQMVRDAYLAGMNEAKREEDGAKPLEEIFKKIERMKSMDDIVPLVAFLHRTGFNPLWGIYVDQDERKNDTNILYIGQSGLSLPDRDYYLKDDADSKRVREAYVKYVANMFRFLGENAKTSAQMTESVMRIETELAKASMTQVERRDIEKQYNKRTLSKFTKEAPGVDWTKYLSLAGAGSPKEIIIAQPLFMKRAGELLRDQKDSLSLDEWKIYFKWHVLNESAGFLSKKFVRENFRFYSTTLAGIIKERPMWERVVGFIDGTIGEALGKLYVEKYFDHEAKKKINELVDNLFAAYRERIQNLDWMMPKTKKLALKKLDGMRRKLGYPDKWKGYKGLKITPDSYIVNYWRAHEFEWRRMVRKLGKKPDLKEWHMTPQTVNAYYNPVGNEIAFPAGIMQPPFFDPRADDAVNYGAIGAVIGHEITHGFDDQGCQFDATGNFKNWWTDEDKKKFHAKVKVIEEQYDNYVAIDDMKVNGKLTAGENIADLGGLTIAFAAFKRSQEGKESEVLDGFTPEQRFFLGFALFEQGIIRPELLKKYLVIDPHSPAMFRINGPVSNMPEFVEAFGAKTGDKLYREPNKRARIW
jgi:putative endopeptidase